MSVPAGRKEGTRPVYQALYRKWRPKAFADVIGQEHITETLRRQVAEGRTSHAYLFTGTRGTGKTTCAKILAKAVNCEAPVDGDPCGKCPSCVGIDSGGFLDVLELDAASNNGVDQVRALRDEAVYSPANVKKRVYIVDEVHMLSAAAFNALLKILEEPPEHLMFILATTELHKVPATILSRCQRFSFRRIQPGAYRFFYADTDQMPMPASADIETLDSAWLGVYPPHETFGSLYLNVVSNAIYTVYLLQSGTGRNQIQNLILMDR